MTGAVRFDRVRTNDLNFWPVRGAIACVAALQMLVVNDLSPGPRWLAPALELALVVPRSAATAWNQNCARWATTDAHWASINRHYRPIRSAVVLLTALVTIAMTAALMALVHALPKGKASSGSTSLIAALNV